MRSSLPAPKCSASTKDFSRNLKNAIPSTAAKQNREKGAQCRLPLQNRKNVLQNCLEKPLIGLRKSTTDNNDLKSFEKQLPRSSVSTDKNRRFSTGSFNQNSLRKLNRKMDTKFKKVSYIEENPLNATFCLPCSEGKHVGSKGLDLVMVQQSLPNIDAASSVPDPELTLSPHLPCTPTAGNLSNLLTSFVTKECLRIAAQLSNKSETCPVIKPDALNLCPVTNVSVINEEPMPFDCSVSYCSDTSPAKSPRVGCTSELPGNSLKDGRCQIIHTGVEIKSKDSFSAKMEDKNIDTETLPFSSGNLIQFDETMLPSDPNELEGDTVPALKSGAYSRNVSQSLTANCRSFFGTEDLTRLDGTMVLNGTLNISSKNEFPDKSAIQAKTLSNSKPSLPQTDLLLCEASLLSAESLAVPKQSVCFGNEFQKPTDLTDFVQNLAPGDLIQLNETMTLTGKNTTIDSLKDEAIFGDDLPASNLPNFKMSLSTEDAVQLNGTMTLCDKNSTFDASKHEGNDAKTIASTSCKLSLSTCAEFRSNEIMAENDCKNATFDTSKNECNLGNDPHRATDLPPPTGDKVQLNDTMTLDHKNATFNASKNECNLGNDPNKATDLLSPSTGDRKQLNDTVTLDHKNATFEVSKHEGCCGGDFSKVTTLSRCMCTGETVQLNGTVTDCKDGRFDSSKGGDSVEMKEAGKTTTLPSCKPSPSPGGLNDLGQLNSKRLKLVRKSEGCALISGTELQGTEHNESNNSKDPNVTLNLGKDNSKCSVKSEANQGSDGNISCSSELHRRPSDVVKSPRLRDSMQKEEFNVCESADLVHDAESSEWAPYCMSTPNVAMKSSILEYPPFDHSFQTSSSILQDDTHVAVVDCPDKQVPKDDSSSGSNENETKSSSGNVINAPKFEEQLKETKVVATNSSKTVSSLPVARRKNVNLAPLSQEYKCTGEKKSLPLSARNSRPGSSSMGRGGRPPIHPPSLSKSRLVLGRPSSVVGTGQSAAGNELPPCQIGMNTKILAKTEPKVITRIPGIKKKSPPATSKGPAQEPCKSDPKLVQLFNLGMADPPRANKSAHKPLVLASKSIVTGIKRPGSAMEQKSLCPSPKRPKAVGGVTAKLPKKSEVKLLQPLELKHKRGLEVAEKLTSEPKVNQNKSPVVESESKQELEVAKLQRKIKELEEKIVVLELENAALRQKERHATGLGDSNV